ncbi:MULTISPECIES: hypothetical protein [Comamonas]|uniref:Uncharacterized protein n=1 Tax=Comamonas squillarum TaxID=2977320 RepID=A0ABY6A2M1_9BURK|nr:MULTISPECIES: hypothetical protein [Comamonas]UXC19155.1 hypothetical protein N4T19_03240 [Comamonas sp. PR12]
MKNKDFIIDVRPVRSELLSAKEFLKLADEEPTLIEKVEFRPPAPGRKGFGEFFVNYTRSRHRRLVNG